MSILTKPSSARLDRRDGLPAAWWMMEGPRRTFPGDTGDVADLIGNTPAAVRTGGCLWTTPADPTPYGAGLDFDGSTGYLATGLIPPDSWPGITFGITLELRSVAGFQMFMSTLTTGPGLEIRLESGADFLEAAAGSAGTSATDTYHVVGTGFHRVHATFDGANILLYRDGQLVASGMATADGSVSSGNQVVIGARPSVNLFADMIAADAKVWPHVLSPGAIARDAFDPWRALRPRGRVSLRAAGFAAIPFIPPSLAAPLEAWYEADSGTYQNSDKSTPAAANADPVAKWADRTANGNDLPAYLADGGTNTLVVPGRNGKPVVACDNASFRLATLANELSTPFSIVVVWSQIDRTSGNHVFDSYGGHAHALLWDNGGAGPQKLSVASADGSVYVVDGTVHVPSTWAAGLMVFDGASSEYWRDGFPVHTVSPGTPTTSVGLSLNNSISGFSNAGNALYAAFLVYRGDIRTDPQLADLFNYLSGKWATRTASVVASGGPAAGNFFPTTFLLVDGTIVATFNNGTTQSSLDNILRCTRSTDGGVTWSDPATILSDGSAACISSNSGCKLASGHLLLMYVKQDGSGTITDSGSIISTDGGETWSSARSMGTFAGYGHIQPYGRPFEVTSGGTILAPAWGHNGTSGETDSLLLQSTDGGTTWTLKSVIAAGDATPKNFNEASVLAITSTNYLAFVRDDNLASGIWKVSSTDGGATWGTPTLFDPSGDGDSPMISPDLMKLSGGSGGTIQLSAGQRFGSPAVGIRQFTSSDGGATMTELPFLWQHVGTGDFGYPSTVQRGSNPPVTLFYDANQAIRASLVIPAGVIPPVSGSGSGCLRLGNIWI